MMVVLITPPCQNWGEMLNLRRTTSIWAIQSVWWSAIIAYWISLKFPVFSSFLTFLLNSDIGPPAEKNSAFGGVKPPQKQPKKNYGFLIHTKNTFCKKKWSKTDIPALSSGLNNLHPAIWGCHHQLDDQYRNPNANNRDYLVGQLTRVPMDIQVEEVSAP